MEDNFLLRVILTSSLTRKVLQLKLSWKHVGAEARGLEVFIRVSNFKVETL